jgi:hypothetical protein
MAQRLAAPRLGGDGQLTFGGTGRCSRASSRSWCSPTSSVPRSAPRSSATRWRELLGRHDELKGVAGEWHLFAVDQVEAPASSRLVPDTRERLSFTSRKNASPSAFCPARRSPGGCFAAALSGSGRAACRPVQCWWPGFSASRLRGWRPRGSPHNRGRDGGLRGPDAIASARRRLDKTPAACPGWSACLVGAAADELVVALGGEDDLDRVAAFLGQ